MRMMMENFKTAIEDYLMRTGMKPSKFGREFLNDPGFVYRLREGGECRPSTIEKVKKSMAEKEHGQDAA
ncbi:hypothetical protein JQW92_18185 [Sulfitobacter pseudonitzschiae]|uniref:hypothetical protein n=4 Tax=Pseudosulfitobacter pseudonitzschiae TaxID=1402135 RepID=UPI001AFB7ECB|nr:hypothetical protein [Pseudosulfitobacter pseudonitzschiae]MBM1843901.1 hypothetical protein [Pseudosulfitobacter pseudonitzschiae]MBM1853597.1 hypothetical protein [Pseudosulfitobacter pseudonitzschiae]MBM1882664.1 hypothetical protein [Pseudosulfitobacter pseudonitzschiae]MBM1887445.1 hypothetical protein [Pseudosulfitobacter pseudonitzschiae]MBM1892380.1 hypothetical protein [Pseudosulfitobacter pseudonitzschiae]